MKIRVSCLVGCAAVLAAHFSSAETPPAAKSADILIIGEFHDNTAHHTRQASIVREVAAKAVVFEMLTPDEAARVGPDTDYSGFHWSNITDYTAIFEESPIVIGAALPRDQVFGAFERGAAAIFGPDAGTYGLGDSLPDAQQAAREELQYRAHCEAMPRDMMGGMVEAQRLRDAAFAKAVLEAYDAHGAPVVLITGNGHARTDWGVPQALKAARPGLDVFSIGQGEDGVAPAGTFDLVFDAAATERGDPCASLR